MQARPEAVPARSLCPGTTVITVTNVNECDSVLCSCAELPFYTPPKRWEFERWLTDLC